MSKTIHNFWLVFCIILNECTVSYIQAKMNRIHQNQYNHINSLCILNFTDERASRRLQRTPSTFMLLFSFSQKKDSSHTDTHKQTSGAIRLCHFTRIRSTSVKTNRNKRIPIVHLTFYIWTLNFFCEQHKYCVLFLDQISLFNPFGG